MRTLLHSRFVLALILSMLGLAPATLQAQATKIFVASTGNDANDGSRGSPKRNFQAAHDAVAAGGQIVVLDTAGYGALTITKSLAVTVPPGVNGFVTVSGSSDAITINTGAGDSVSLRGLIVEQSSPGNNGSGIAANSVSNLAIEECAVRNFAKGIRSTSTVSIHLFVHNSAVRGCNSGLSVEYAGVATAANVTGCRLEQNGQGITVVPTGTGGGSADVSLADCVLSGNSTGILTSGSGSVVRVSKCAITGNMFGVNTSGGQLLSRGNNTLENNFSFNTFPGTYNAK